MIKLEFIFPGLIAGFNSHPLPCLAACLTASQVMIRQAMAEAPACLLACLTAGKAGSGSAGRKRWEGVADLTAALQRLDKVGMGAIIQTRLGIGHNTRYPINL